MGRARKAKKKKGKSRGGGFLTEPSLFEDEEGTFLDNFSKRRVFVHLVPAPWSRVIVLSLVYGFAVNFVKIVWFEVVGRPNWLPAVAESSQPQLPPDPAAGGQSPPPQSGAGEP